jgi:hypothetical protein
MLTNLKKASFDEKYPAPANIKSASLQSLNEPSGVFEHMLYADPQSKQYPGHSAAATWYSALQLHERKQAGELIPPAVQENIDKRLRLFKLDSAFKQATAVAPATPVFALKKAAVDGKVYEMFPVGSTEEALKSAEQLVASRAKLPLQDARKAASAILEKLAGVEHMDSEVQDSLERIAGKGYASAPLLAEELKKRAGIVASRKGPKEVVDNLKQAAEIALSVHDSDEVKHAFEQVIEDLDRKYDLAQFWGKAIRPAEQITNRFLPYEVKLAAQEFVGFSSGNFYKISEINKIAKQTAERFPVLFVEDLADGRLNFTKSATVGMTLSDEARVDAFFMSQGLVPVKLGIPPRKLVEFQGAL